MSTKRWNTFVANQFVSTLGCVIIGSVLVYAGLAKVRQPYDFLRSVYDYSLFGPQFGLIVARLVPWIEVVVGSVLLFGVMRLGSLSIVTTMFFFFAASKLSVLWRGIQVDCGCLGFMQNQAINPLNTLFTVALFFFSCFLLWISSKADSHFSP